MSDKYDYSPPESMRRTSALKTAVIIAFFTSLAIGPPLLAWETGDPEWLWGWLVLLIFGLAG